MIKSWTPRTTYYKDDVFKFKGILYKVLETFISGRIFDENDSRYVRDIQNVNLSDEGGAYIKAIPDVLITGGGEKGIAPRLRVDIAQTGFFAAREFRTIKEFDLLAGTQYVIKAIVNINTILFDLQVNIIAGEIKLYTKTGGTESGTFSETLPMFARNYMTVAPSFTPHNSLVAGGSHTGGVTLDLLWIKTDSNSNKSTSNFSALNSERGIAPGVYYFILDVQVAAKGVLSAWWEEYTSSTPTGS